MGWSKYDEDNRELREERVALRNMPTVFTLQNLISASIEAYPQKQAVTAEIVSPVDSSRLPKAFKKKRLVCKDCGAKFKAAPHKDCVRIAPSDFSSDCSEMTRAYGNMSRSFWGI